LEQQKIIGKKDGIMAPEILREYRKARRESQYRFWSRFGVTQTRGSRFETGMKIPPPIVILLKLYFEGIITDGDLWRARRRRSSQAVG
jgi:transcriptional regulator with XRE-family HTH domain